MNSTELMLRTLGAALRKKAPEVGGVTPEIQAVVLKLLWIECQRLPTPHRVST